MAERMDGPARDTTPVPPVALVWGIFAVWITFFSAQFIELFHMRPAARFVLVLVGTLGFFGLYLWMGWQIGRRLVNDTFQETQTPRQVWSPIVALVGLSAALAANAGPDWGGLFIYTAAIAAAHLPVKRSAWLVGGLALIAVVGTWASSHDWHAVLAALFTVLVTGFTTMAMRWAFLTNRELRRARRELAQLAVTEERLRFARDLHDLLGHTLSLIALKSELAGRLVPVAPERAAVEIADVESAARQALHEVREAVAGYRQPALADELRAAREMLAAAAIILKEDIADLPRPLRNPVEGMLAWTVREGVTNVIRHSRARRCVITLAQEEDAVMLTVSDDGRHDQGAPDACIPGNGLRGIAERAAALGGTSTAGPSAAGGFALRVTLPLAETTQRISLVGTRNEVR